MIKIRKVQRRDIKTLAELHKALWGGNVKSHVRDIQRFLKARKFFGVIAWAEGETSPSKAKKAATFRAVGFAEATIRPFANGCDFQPVPFVEGLWVHPKFRRQKIGRHMIAEIEKWALSKHFKELGSDAYIDAHLSHKAHRGYGFKEMERVVYFRKKL